MYPSESAITTRGGLPTDNGDSVVTIDQVPCWSDTENRLTHHNEDPTFSNSLYLDPLASSSGGEISGNGVMSKFPVDHEINSKIYLWRGDPWNLEVDAVVNSTNENLDEAHSSPGIHAASGPSLAEECSSLGGCRTGMAKLTKSYNLPARRVIHTVGPKYAVKYHTAAETALSHCYQSCLELLVEDGLQSIAMGCIYTEAKSYPREPAAHVAIRTVRRFLEKQKDKIKAVVFCISTSFDTEIYKRLLPLYFPRDKHEEEVAMSKLPADVGDENGGTVIHERKIRIKPLPNAKKVDPRPLQGSMDLPVSDMGLARRNSSYLESYLDPAFMSLIKNPDQRRMEQWEKSAQAQSGWNCAKMLGYGDLGGPPLSPAEEYSLHSRYLSKANSVNLSEISEMKIIYPGEDSIFSQSQSNEIVSNCATQGQYHSIKGHLPSPKTHEAAYMQPFPSATPQLTHSDSFVLDIIDQLQDSSLGQTLKRPFVTPPSIEEQRFSRKEDSGRSIKFIPKGTKGIVGSSLILEVIAGPSRGFRCSVQSKMASRLPLTLGRVSPSDLLLKDSEVSGKHALINWNVNELKWEVVDMGSLNGTLLNSRSICHPDPESRHWGDPTELADGDVVTLGTSTKISVQIKSQTEFLIPFGVGIASDPMALRRGGKKLPMEDVCYYRWPLPGSDQFGVFGICDGHGGAAAAISASKALPETVANILSDSLLRERVLSQCNATDVLRHAFEQTESFMNHYYEGCTATVLLVWADDHENFFAQCANVGDSACLMNVNGKQIKMSEDHRITSYSERLRIQEIGEPLKDGETRLCGLNLGRMLGDKFLKQQDNRFSSQPYISQVVPIQHTSGDFALLASDGFWDVVNLKKAFQLVQQGREKYVGDRENFAEKVANFLLSEARTQRTKDNTSIIFLDFDRSNTNSHL